MNAGSFFRLGAAVAVSGAILAAWPAIGAEPRANATLVSCERIWDAAPHSAFTDLTRFKDRWWCVFREGRGHVSPDGAARVLESGDGKEWRSAAELKSDRGDLRDPKVLVTPDGRLMLIAAVALHPRGAVTHQTLVWFSDDGRDWGEPADIGEPNVWLWRVAWAGKTAYGAGYSVGAERFVRWYESADGRNFRTVVPRFDVDGYANETALVFKPDGEAVCLLRRDGQGAGATAQLGIAAPPYRSWKWTDLGVQIGGPAMIRLPDGRFIAAVRFYDGGARTSLAWVDVERGGLREVLRLPSGGDTSYAGLVWHEDSLWISYYSSHEGKSAIYFARARLGE